MSGAVPKTHCDHCFTRFGQAEPRYQHGKMQLHYFCLKIREKMENLPHLAVSAIAPEEPPKAA